MAISKINSKSIEDGIISADDLAAGSISTAKIADSAVTAAKINDGDISTAKIADSAVTAAKVADSTLTLAKLSATGTKDATTFLRGDNTFASAGGTNTPAFSVYSSAGLANTTYGTTTKVPFNTEKFDTDSAFDSTTNYRFTVPSGKDGKYLIHLKLRVNDGTDTDGARASIFKNGSEVSISSGRVEFFDTYEVTALLDLVATDYIEAYFSVEFGTQGVVGGDNSGSQFFGYRIIE